MRVMDFILVCLSWCISRYIVIYVMGLMYFSSPFDGAKGEKLVIHNAYSVDMIWWYFVMHTYGNTLNLVIYAFFLLNIWDTLWRYMYICDILLRYIIYGYMCMFVIHAWYWDTCVYVYVICVIFENVWYTLDFVIYVSCVLIQGYLYMYELFLLIFAYIYVIFAIVHVCACSCMFLCMFVHVFYTI